MYKCERQDEILSLLSETEYATVDYLARKMNISSSSIRRDLKNLEERDYIDSHREVSPLTQAPDAVVLDNSHMTMQDQLEWLKDLITERFGC